MRTIWHSLAWKEWHEHKWKLAAIVAIVFGATALSIIDFDRDSISVASLVAVSCLLPLTIFVAVGDAVSEHSNGTLRFLQALPIPRWRVAFNKLVFGLLTCVAPLILIVLIQTIAVYYLRRSNQIWYPEFYPPLNNRHVATIVLWGLAILSYNIVAIVSFYLWTVAIAVNRKDEVSGGAAALAVIAAVWSLSAPLLHYLDASPDNPPTSIILSVLPGGFAAVIIGSLGNINSGHWLIPLIGFAVVHVGLAAWYIRRFTGAESNVVASPRAEVVGTKSSWIASPRRSRLSAIIWKQTREITPVLAVGLAAVPCILMAIYFVDDTEFRSITNTARMTIFVIGYVGFLVTLVIGVGLFLNDLSPQINTFWRSRPIAPAAWYWTKYATGLTTLAGALLLPVAFANYLVPQQQLRLNEQEFLLAIAVYVCVFASAVAMTCLVRHAVYAAVLTLALLGIGIYFVLLAHRGAMWIGILHAADARIWSDPTEGEVLFAMILTTVVATFVGWFAVRNDWGWKSGRG